MTCIVGIAQSGRVWIGGDAAATFGDWLSCQTASKVFRVGDMLIGAAGSPRVTQLVEHVFTPPARAENSSAMGYLVGPFMEELKNVLRQHGALQPDKGADQALDSTHLVIGYQSRLYYVDGLFSVFERDDGIDSAGSGSSVAMGYLLATPKKEPKTRILGALAAAACVIPSVSGPFNVEEL